MEPTPVERYQWDVVSVRIMWPAFTTNAPILIEFKTVLTFFYQLVAYLYTYFAPTS